MIIIMKFIIIYDELALVLDIFTIFFIILVHKFILPFFNLKCSLNLSILSF